MKSSTKLVVFILLTVLLFENIKIELCIIYSLISLIFICVCLIFNNKIYCDRIIILFAVLACFLHPFAVFIPAFIYEVSSENKIKYSIFMYIPVLLSCKMYSYQFVLLLTVIYILSLVMTVKESNDLKRVLDYQDERDHLVLVSNRLEERIGELNCSQNTAVSVAVLNERNRIAREIHDNVGHLLSSAILQLGAIKTITKEEDTKKYLITLQNTLDSGMQSIRSSVHNLYEDSFDLKDNLLKIIDNFIFCKCDFIYNVHFDPGIELKYSVISIVKEALNNVVKHSNATKVTVSFVEFPALYQLKIHDNGIVKRSSYIDGIGIKSIKQRVNALGGMCNIITDNGFMVFVTFGKEQ